MNVRTRRSLSVSLTLLAVGLTAIALQSVHDRLGDPATLSGWTLLASTAALYMLGARKQIISPMIVRRLGRVAIWLQFHIYMGTFASLIFLMHIGWPVRGPFEICLATCFAIVAVSGIVLAIMNRRIPRKLTAVAPAERLEHIPTLQAAVARDAHATALASADLGEGATLAEHYQQHLLPFFQAPRGLLYQLVPNGSVRRRLLRDLADLQRYLADHGNASRQQLAEMIKAKDDLDYQYALQSRLRLLVALHVALTWSLALLIGVHIVLVYRFQGAL